MEVSVFVMSSDAKSNLGTTMEMGEREIIYIYIPTATSVCTTRMTSALRRATMRAILMFHNCDGQSHETVSTDHNF